MTALFRKIDEMSDAVEDDTTDIAESMTAGMLEGRRRLWAKYADAHDRRLQSITAEVPSARITADTVSGKRMLRK